MTDRELVELDRLKEILRYEPDTGVFYWLKSNSNVAPIGAIAGIGVNNHGYRQISIDGRQYRAHRLAWFYSFGKWPMNIDHINGIRHDNRLVNLRDVTTSVNNQNRRIPQKNNSTGFLGVSLRSCGKFQAEIRVGGVKKYLGTFKTAEAAHEAYVLAKRDLHEGCAL